MTTFLVIVVTLSWYAYSMFEGMREGDYWHILGFTSIKPGTFYEHITWSFQRFFVYCVFSMTLLFICESTKYPFWDILFILSSLPLAFVFIHDGVDYSRRHQLDSSVYPKGFWDNSTTSTSTLDKLKLTTFPKRLIYFIISIIEIILLVTLK